MNSEELARALLESGLNTAWLYRCGTNDSPGNWFIPGEFLGVVDDSPEVMVYPTYASLDVEGEPRGWSTHYDPNKDRIVPAWEWRIEVDRLSELEIDTIELQLNGCFDSNGVSFMTLGRHDKKPPVEDYLVKAFELIRRGY